MDNSIIIRRERTEEEHLTENLVRESFWNVYRPGCLEHFLLHELRRSEAFVPELNFVMLKDGHIIGQNVFVRTELSADSGDFLPILTMGPICIANELKRHGYGKKLLDFSLVQAANMGFGAVCFEGNIDFYSCSGFTFARYFGIRYHGLPQGEDDSFFLAKELKPGYLSGFSGEYATPSCYLVDPEEADDFDSSFTKKEKLRLPGQIFC